MCSTCGCKGAEDSDISKNIFGNMRDAKKRAKQLGTTQIHSHDLNGDKVFMPFKTHQEYQKNMGAEDGIAKKVKAFDNKEEFERTFTLDLTMDAIDEDDFANEVLNLTPKELMEHIVEVKDAESFDWDDDDWRDWGEGMTIPQKAKALSKMSWDEVDEETGYGDDLFDWFDKWDKKSLKERETYALRVLKESYGAESFEAESNFDKLANKIAAQYRKKGKSAKEAMKIGKATAAKIGFKKYGKAGMRRKAMRGRMAKGAEGSMPKKSIIPNVIIFGVLGVTAYLATKIKSVEFGADGDCGCGCKGAKVGGCGDTKEADEGHYPETFDPVQDWLPRYRYPEDSDWSNSYNPADPYRPLDYQTVQVDSRTTVDKMGMI